MADPPDLDALASRYLDFWQEQAAAMTANPALADLVSKLFGALGPGAAGFASPSTNQHEQSKPDPKQGGAAERGGPSAGGGAAASGAASAGAASVADDDRLDELLRRLTDLEKRIAALEAGGSKRRS